MSLKVDQLHQLSLLLSQKLKGSHLSKIIQYDDSTFVMANSRGGRLVFSLNSADPLVYISPSSFQVTSFSTNMSMIMRKQLSNAVIDDIAVLNNDRVLAFSVTSINDVYQEEKLTLIAELIPTKANLILLDKDKKVIAALRTNTIESPRPIFRGVTYEAPLGNNFVGGEANPFDYDSYTASCIKKEAFLEQRRKKSKYHSLFVYLSSKKKAANRKIKSIEMDIEKANEHLNDGEYGNFIFMNLDNIDVSTGVMDYYGTPVELDKRRSASDNAEAFFKRAKKAKATVKLGQSNLEKAKKELEEYTQVEKILSLASEDSLEAYSKQYGLDKIKDGKSTPLSDSAILPYSVTIDEVTYLFGKNARQNDCLSFLLDTAKTHIWIHVKDNHGAHLIIKKDNPSEEEIEKGCELALLASNLEMGEVMYTPHVNVRRGNVPGQAIVKEYRSALIRSISPQVRDAYASARKVSL